MEHGTGHGNGVLDRISYIRMLNEFGHRDTGEVRIALYTGGSHGMVGLQEGRFYPVVDEGDDWCILLLPSGELSLPVSRKALIMDFGGLENG